MKDHVLNGYYFHPTEALLTLMSTRTYAFTHAHAHAHALAHTQLNDSKHTVSQIQSRKTPGVACEH